MDGTPDSAALSAAELLELNRDVQGTRALRLLATTNLSLYSTLMERHLSGGTIPETELVVPAPSILISRKKASLDTRKASSSPSKSNSKPTMQYSIIARLHQRIRPFLTK